MVFLNYYFKILWTILKTFWGAEVQLCARFSRLTDSSLLPPPSHLGTDNHLLRSLLNLGCFLCQHQKPSLCSIFLCRTSYYHITDTRSLTAKPPKHCYEYHYFVCLILVWKIIHCGHFNKHLCGQTVSFKRIIKLFTDNTFYNKIPILWNSV